MTVFQGIYGYYPGMTGTPPFMKNYEEYCGTKDQRKKIIIAGNLKSGTSNLAFHLSHSPALAFPSSKETNCLWAGKCVAACYKFNFRSAHNSSLIGIDASPEYWNHNDVESLVSELTADTHIFFLVRDPAQWLVSMFFHQCNEYFEEKSIRGSRYNTQTLFSLWLYNFDAYRQTMKGFGMRHVYDYCMGNQIERYVRNFGKDRVHVIKTESMENVENMVVVLDKILNLYNVSSNWQKKEDLLFRVNTVRCRGQENKIDCGKETPFYYENVTTLVQLAEGFIHNDTKFSACSGKLFEAAWKYLLL